MRNAHAPRDRAASPVHRDLIFEWGGLSHGGARNAVNEDCFFLGRFDRSLEPILTNLHYPPASGWQHTVGYVAIVADGMGGLGVGELASQASVATLLDLVLETPDWIMRYDEEPLAAEVSRRITTRLRQVDGMLESLGRRRVGGTEIGSTVTIFATVPPYAIVAHVGNSRAYMVRAGTLYRLTTDETAGRLRAAQPVCRGKVARTRRRSARPRSWCGRSRSGCAAPAPGERRPSAAVHGWAHGHDER